MAFVKQGNLGKQLYFVIIQGKMNIQRIEAFPVFIHPQFAFAFISTYQSKHGTTPWEPNKKNGKDDQYFGFKIPNGERILNLI